jgi:hypothetical protein
LYQQSFHSLFRELPEELQAVDVRVVIEDAYRLALAQ